MAVPAGSTLRLNMPQWQGGNLPAYHFGAELLAWLAPAPQGLVETIAVPEPRQAKRSPSKTACAPDPPFFARHERRDKQSRSTNPPGF